MRSKLARQRDSTRDDYDRLKDAAHKLRAENRKLRKENATLRKALNRVADYELDREDEVSEDLILVSVETPEKRICPKCKIAELKELRAGKYLIQFCSCGHRKRSEAGPVKKI